MFNDIPHGDMPGDKIKITGSHIEKADKIFPLLQELLKPVSEESVSGRAVVSVYGGSGVGKSEIASLLAYNLEQTGVGCYTLSGDNYPHRIPSQNDAERLRIFRYSGIQGLIIGGQYTDERFQILNELQKAGEDANEGYISKHPWLAVYHKAGCGGLKGYLGTPSEINFGELTNILSQFKDGASGIYLKRMGRTETDLWYDVVDFSKTSVIILEWTHGNSDFLEGVDIPIFLNSTPQETLEHRKTRNRDGGADSPFTSIVLNIEQTLLALQTHKARLVVSKSGEIL